MADKILEWLDQVPHHRAVLIAGPTASGKSALALALAERQGRQIVNADALQVFGCWRVLTARPTVDDEARVPHALYGHVPGAASYSAGQWLREVAGILADDPRPVIVGGTGLNFAALTEGLADIPPVPTGVRAEADAILAGAGLAALLAGVDAATAARIDRANPARVQRAWEVLRATGRGLADWQAATGAPLLPLHRTHALVLRADRDWLGARIEARFAAMLQDGALDEARAALPGWNPAHLSAKAIGAADLIAHLRGEIGLDMAANRAKTASRQYAKRQQTWFRSRMAEWHNLQLP